MRTSVWAFKMRTAGVVAGASLFALLIVDICCLPLEKGFNPSPYDGAGYKYAPDVGSDKNNAPSKGVSTLHYQPAVVTQPAAPVSSVYGGKSVKPHPDGSAHQAPAFHHAPQDINWAVAPPSHSSGGKELLTGPYGGGPGIPGPVYQAGELSHYEKSYEDGDFQSETEEQGFLPPIPPPVQLSTGQGFTSHPQPPFRPHGRGPYPHPYPYYDFMFLTGSYPPGTVTHASSSYEQGTDHWQDTHYVRDYLPYHPGPVQQIETFPGVPEALKGSETQWPYVKGPAVVGYGHDGAQVGQPAYYGGFTQPQSSYQEPPLSQAGHNQGDVGY